MNEQLQQALLEFIQKANHGVNFAVDQLPDALRDTMSYVATASLIYAVVLTLLAITLSILSKKVYRFVIKSDNDMFDDLGLWIVFGVLMSASILLSLPIVGQIVDWIHVVFYPKAWILEYVRSFR